jgi:hypothetical protein
MVKEDTVMRKKSFMVLGLTVAMSLSLPLLSYAAQSARWVGSGDRWQVSDNQGGFIKDCWFEDDVQHEWYMLGAEDGSVMYSGLVTDKSTGKSYMLNTVHDGTYGRMLTVNGVYNVNGVDVYMTFNQAHDGSFGAITSGLDEVRRTGVNERNLDRIPTDNNGNTNTGKSQNNQPTNNGSLSEYDKQFDRNKDGVLDENELINKTYLEDPNFNANKGQDYGRDWQ